MTDDRGLDPMLAENVRTLKPLDLSLWTEGDLYLHSTVSPHGEPSGWVRAQPGNPWWGVIENGEVLTLSRMQALQLNSEGWASGSNRYVARDDEAWLRMRKHFELEAERERERLDRERQAFWNPVAGPVVFPDVEECRLMMQRYHPDKPDGDREKFEKWQQLLDQAKRAATGHAHGHGPGGHGQ